MVRCEEYEKAKTAACRAEEEGGGSTAKSVEKKKRVEEEARNKVLMSILNWFMPLPLQLHDNRHPSAYRCTINIFFELRNVIYLLEKLKHKLVFLYLHRQSKRKPPIEHASQMPPLSSWSWSTRRWRCCGSFRTSSNRATRCSDRSERA